VAKGQEQAPGVASRLKPAWAEGLRSLPWRRDSTSKTKSAAELLAGKVGRPDRLCRCRGFPRRMISYPYSR